MNKILYEKLVREYGKKLCCYKYKRNNRRYNSIYW